MHKRDCWLIWQPFYHKIILISLTNHACFGFWFPIMACITHAFFKYVVYLEIWNMSVMKTRVKLLAKILIDWLSLNVTCKRGYFVIIQKQFWRFERKCARTGLMDMAVRNSVHYTVLGCTGSQNFQNVIQTCYVCDLSVGIVIQYWSQKLAFRKCCTSSLNILHSTLKRKSIFKNSCIKKILDQSCLFPIETYGI